MKRVLPFLLVTYALSLPWTVSLYVDLGTRIRLFQARPFTIAVLTVTGLLWCILWAAVSIPRETRVPLVMSLAFPAFLLAISPVRGDIPLEVIALYALWGIFSFALAPMLLKQALGTTMKWIALSYGATLMGFMYLVLTRGPAPSELRGRIPTMGLQNENYYAQVPELLLCAFALWLACRNRSLKPAALMWVAVIVHLALIDARGGVVFAFFLGAAYLYFAHGQRWIVKALAPMAVVLVAFATASYVADYESKNPHDVTANRIVGWQGALESMHKPGVGTPLLNWMTGTPDDEVDPGRQATLALQEAATFSTFRVENGYVETLILGGIVGLLLFLAPYVYVFRKALVQKRTRLTNLALAILVAGAMQNMSSAVLPTFGAPAGLLLALVACLPLIGGPYTSTNREREGRHPLGLTKTGKDPRGPEEYLPKPTYSSNVGSSTD